MKAIYFILGLVTTLATIPLTAQPTTSNQTNATQDVASNTQQDSDAALPQDQNLAQESKTTKDTSTSDIESRTLEKQVVTASGYWQKIKDAPASISVIEKEEILTRPIRDIGDAVQDVPGVYTEVDKTGQNTISMRGLDSSYTLILIDGKRQNVAQGFSANGFGGATQYLPIPPVSMIERIEVIRGPASIIYGSDAMGGVINIITKKDINQFATSAQVNTRLAENHQVFGNIYGVNAYLHTPIIKDRLSVNLRGAYNYGGQNAILNPLGASNSNNNNPFSSHASTGFENWNAGTRINYKPDSHNWIYLDADVYNGHFGSLNTSSRSVTSVQELWRMNYVLSHEADYSWGKLSSYIQYAQTIIAPHVGANGGNLPIGAWEGSSINYSSMRENKDIVYQTTYTKNFNLKNFGAIIFNGGIYNQWQNLFNRNSRFERDMNQFAIFAEGQYIINDYISTTLGLRYNYSNIFRSIPNPRFFVNINPTRWLTFKGGIYSGVRVPNLSYLYPGILLSDSTGVIGNEDLLPETSWNYELSTIFDTNMGSLILTGYYTDFTNQIEQVALNNSVCDAYNSQLGYTTCAGYRNIGKSLMAGFELGLKTKELYGFSLDATYAFTHTQILADAQTLDGTGNAVSLIGEPVNSIPRNSFTIKPNYRYKNFDAYIRWQGRFQTPTPAAGANSRTNVRSIVGDWYKDYQIVDIAASYRFLKQHLTLTFSINNLFDVNFIDYRIYTNNNAQSYQNLYQRYLPSRNYWLALRMDF